MCGKKTVVILFIFLMTFPLAGCDNNKPPGLNGTQGNETSWLLKQLDFKNDTVDQVQQTARFWSRRREGFTLSGKGNSQKSVLRSLFPYILYWREKMRKP